ncbi:MAG: hypothetical protein R3E32_09270 [Chitinophagales bacterium]
MLGNRPINIRLLTMSATAEPISQTTTTSTVCPTAYKKATNTPSKTT